MYEYSTTENTTETLTTLVRDELMYQYKCELEEGSLDEELLSSLLRVIQYYSNGAEWREFIRQLNEINEENENAV